MVTPLAPRVHLGTAAPSAMRALRALHAEVGEQARAAGLDPFLVLLVQVRVSQVNGCAFCLQMHTTEARAAGETADRLAVLPAWREASCFTGPERAALALAEAVTLVADGHVPDDAYAAAVAQLSTPQVTAVAWVAIVMNAFNRVATTSRYPVGQQPAGTPTPRDAP